MKKAGFLIILLITIFYSYNVYATDNVISMNKYKEEIFTFTKNSYKDNQIDGVIVGGYVLKEAIEEDNKEYNDYQAIVAKYDDKNKLVWSYLYGDKTEDYLDYLDYSYDSEGIINGYLLVVRTTNDTYGANYNETCFIKLDLEGKVVLEKPLGVNRNIIINKLLTTSNSGVVDGYIATGNNGESSFLVRLDKDLNIVWIREQAKDVYQSINYSDLTTVTYDDQIVGFAVIREYKVDEKQTISQLIRFNSLGEEAITIVEDLSKYDSYFLTEALDGFILYGATSEIKLPKGNTSYYLINYNSNNEAFWETIGEDPLNKNKLIKLIPNIQDNKLIDYLLLYSNNIDNNSEVIRIMPDGEIRNKIKKVYDEYYLVKDFMFTNNNLYLVGQINCPKDDSCDYDSNSLFLVSDEEKVIEVKDNDSRVILIVTGVLILSIIGVVFYRKKKTKIIKSRKKKIR